MKKKKVLLNFTDVDTSFMSDIEKVMHIIEHNKELYPTEAKYMEALRACIRKAWQHHPMKRLYKESKQKKIKNPRPNPRRGFEYVKGFTCEICKRDFVERDIEVDHKIGENSCTKMADFSNYVQKIVHVAPEDLQILCSYPDSDVRSRERHSCHKVKTYAESEKISFEDALKIKKAISIEKQGDLVVQKYLLKVFDPPLPSNQKLRKNLLREAFLKGLLK